MVARNDQPQDAELDEYGFPQLKGVETRDSEELAFYWGPDWRQKIDEAIADVEAGRVTRFGSTKEFLTFLRQR